MKILLRSMMMIMMEIIIVKSTNQPYIRSSQKLTNTIITSPTTAEMALYKKVCSDRIQSNIEVNLRRKRVLEYWVGLHVDGDKTKIGKLGEEKIHAVHYSTQVFIPSEGNTK